MSMDATTLLSSQLGAAAGTAYIVNFLQKSSYFSWISTHTKTINKVVRATLALAVTIGITYVWAPATGGAHVLTLNIPSWIDLGHGTWHWFCQYAFTHAIGAQFDEHVSPPNP